MALLTSKFALQVPHGFVRRIGWQSLGSLGLLGLGLAQTLTLAKLLGPAAFGTMSLALASAALVFQCADLRLGDAIIRYLPQYLADEEFDRARLLVLGAFAADFCSGVAAFLIFLIAESHFNLSAQPGVEWTTFLLLAGTSSLFSNLSNATAVAIARVLGAFRAVTVIWLGVASARLAWILFGLLFLNWNVKEVLEVFVAASFVSALLIAANALLLARRRLSSLIPQWSVPLFRSDLRRTGKFVVGSYLFGLSALPAKDLDLVVLGSVALPAELGVYKTARTIGQMLLTLVDPIFLVVFPEISNLLAAGKKEETRSLLRSVTVAGFFLALLSYGGVIAAAWLSIDRLLGPSYHQVTAFTAVLGVGVIFYAPVCWMNPLLMASGRMRIAVRWNAVIGAIHVILVVVLTRSFGAWGAAAASAFMSAIWCAILFGALGLWRELLPRKSDDVASHVSSRGIH